MNPSDSIHQAALALGFIFTILGATLFFIAFAIASKFEDLSMETHPKPRGAILLFGDFLLLIMASVPLLSLIFIIHELPATAKLMKEKCRTEPLVRRLLITGSSLLVAAGICFWGMTL
jgi:hypothetical protein